MTEATLSQQSRALALLKTTEDMAKGRSVMYTVSYMRKDGQRFSFKFQLYSDACLFASSVEQAGGTEVTIQESAI